MIILHLQWRSCCAEREEFLWPACATSQDLHRHELKGKKLDENILRQRRYLLYVLNKGH